MCEQSLHKVCILRNENFWRYRLHKLGTIKVLQTDRWMDRGSGPSTRPAFAKAAQVNIGGIRTNKEQSTA